jgi:hypothetical protein
VLARNRYIILSVAAAALSFFAFLRLVSIADLSFSVPATAASFVLETILSGLWWWFLARRLPEPAGFQPSRSKRIIASIILFVAWAVVFGVGLQLVPHEGANSPYGGIGLIGMFLGFFVMMGFIWSVVGE